MDDAAGLLEHGAVLVLAERLSAALRPGERERADNRGVEIEVGLGRRAVAMLAERHAADPAGEEEAGGAEIVDQHDRLPAGFADRERDVERPLPVFERVARLDERERPAALRAGQVHDRRRGLP